MANVLEFPDYSNRLTNRDRQELLAAAYMCDLTLVFLWNNEDHEFASFQNEKGEALFGIIKEDGRFCAWNDCGENIATASTTLEHAEMLRQLGGDPKCIDLNDFRRGRNL